jgi:hypothetical protein
VSDIDFSKLTEKEQAEYQAESEQLPHEDSSVWASRTAKLREDYARLIASRSVAAPTETEEAD